jgi:putative transposase
MSRYLRARIEGGWFFFTLTLTDRSSDLLVRHIGRLRAAYAAAHDRDPFETIAICVLPDHLHAIWALPHWEHALRDDADLSRHIDYIHFNPVKHGLVSRACDWPHISFHRYVAQGCLPMDWGGDVRQPGGISFAE